MLEGRSTEAGKKDRQDCQGSEPERTKLDVRCEMSEVRMTPHPGPLLSEEMEKKVWA